MDVLDVFCLCGGPVAPTCRNDHDFARNIFANSVNSGAYTYGSAHLCVALRRICDFPAVAVFYELPVLQWKTLQMFVRRRTETDWAFAGGRGSVDCLTVDPVCGNHNDEVAWHGRYVHAVACLSVVPRKVLLR
ncbi:hypothetical protein FHX77_000597 [Bifidobacterium commune]|uniref:Uncharacterized protein n=1 Tax=Bifidobacterium commune TaxID=1505727 RepID=A0A1C4GZZ4_9BIFI|nr:hypothetical protein [Bifidobacterium commune]SCC78201.1 hypothetical protein GA0061077_0148 [Bifidobacterium commune]